MEAEVSVTLGCDSCPLVRFDTPAEWVDHQRRWHRRDLHLRSFRRRPPARSRRARARRRGHDRRHAAAAEFVVVPERRLGPMVAEGKPWDLHNSDGSLNLGSYAVAAAEGMVLFAHDLFRDRMRAEGGVVPTPGQLQALARHLLNAADRIQAAVRADGHANRMHNSHVRARAAVRAAVEVYPVPWGRSEETAAWLDSVVEYGTILLRATLALVEA